MTLKLIGNRSALVKVISIIFYIYTIIILCCCFFSADQAPSGRVKRKVSLRPDSYTNLRSSVLQLTTIAPKKQTKKARSTGNSSNSNQRIRGRSSTTISTNEKAAKSKQPVKHNTTNGSPSAVHTRRPGPYDQWIDSLQDVNSVVRTRQNELDESTIEYHDVPGGNVGKFSKINMIIP